MRHNRSVATLVVALAIAGCAGPAATMPSGGHSTQLNRAEVAHQLGPTGEMSLPPGVGKRSPVVLAAQRACSHHQASAGG